MKLGQCRMQVGLAPFLSGIIMDEYCGIGTQQGGIEIALGICIIVGNILSFVPQKRSASGISHYSLFVGQLCNFSTLINASILQFDRMLCCTIESQWLCIVSLLAYIQMIAQMVSSLPVYVLFLVFNPYRENRHTNKSDRFQYYSSIILFAVLLATCIAMASVGFALMVPDPIYQTHARGYAFGLGMLACAATIVQWMPQIVLTLYRGNAGSFSPYMLMVQAPGTTLAAIFGGLAEKENLTTWLQLVFAAAQQWFLLVVLVVFICRDKRRAAVLLQEKNQSIQEEKVANVDSDAEESGSLLKSSKEKM